MSKSSKPLIFYILILLMVATGFFLSVVGVKLGNEELIREKESAEDHLKSERTKKVSLIAEYQELTSEERIRTIAINDLGLVKRLEPEITIPVSLERITEVENFLKEKYE